MLKKLKKIDMSVVSLETLEHLNTCKKGISAFKAINVSSIPIENIIDIYDKGAWRKLWLIEKFIDTTYNEYGDPLTTMYVGGGVQEMIYDDKRNLLEIRGEGAPWSKFTYDDNGNQLTAVYSNGVETKKTYNSDGKLSSTTNRIGVMTTYTYLNGNAVSATDEDGVIWTADYDRDGLLLAQQNRIQNGVQSSVYTYDNRGNVLTLSVGNVTAVSKYDSHDNLIEFNDGVFRDFVDTHDEYGNVLTHTKANPGFNEVSAVYEYVTEDNYFIIRRNSEIIFKVNLKGSK